MSEFKTSSLKLRSESISDILSLSESGGSKQPFLCSSPSKEKLDQKKTDEEFCLTKPLDLAGFLDFKKVDEIPLPRIIFLKNNINL